MGWWKRQGTEDHLGDAPLDALGTAVSVIVAEYRHALGRRPSKAEWEAMLHAVLSNKREEYRPTDDGSVSAVRIELREV